MATRQRLKMRLAIAEGTPEALVGDVARVRQVLVNLLGNAVKFTPWGEVEVYLSASELPDGRIEAHFAVADTGVGIPPEDLDRLFVAFQQIDGTLARQHGGAGLGLAISRRLTELMGGRIWAESTVGEGSTFHFTVVGEPAAAPTPRSAVFHGADRGLAQRHPLKILLAEDHPVNQQVTLSFLEHLGYQADLATDGREVLAALESRPYDVVLMDVQMPDMDGLSATRRIRSQLPAGHQPRIIAMTAHAMPGDRERCLAAGMDGYLSKPVQIAELEEALTAAPHRSPAGAADAAGAAEGPEAAAGLPAEPLDRAMLDQVAGLGLLGTLAGLYAESSAADLARVRRLAAEERWPEAARAAHNLKGSSAALGLVRVAAVCAALEEAVRAERPLEAAPLVRCLEEEVERAREALAGVLQQERGRV